MKVSIFYSWQSDTSPKSNRYYIEDAIKKAIKQINKDSQIVACIDRDTKDQLGSPEIHKSVFEKINHSKFFICDLSLNDHQSPNPNVLIELGYAIKVLGWNKIICLFNATTGKVEDLPFDINHNRVTQYSPNIKGEKNRLSQIITLNIDSLFKKGELYNPIEDHIKKKIDYIVLRIARNIVDIFDFEKSVNLSTRLPELEKMPLNDMAILLSQCKTLGYFFFYNYDDSQIQLETILNQLLSYSYFSDSWRVTVIHLIDWIDMWNHTVDPHFSPNLFKSTTDSDYIIKDMDKENSKNPPNSVVLLKRYKDDKYTIVQGGSFKGNILGDKIVCLQDCYGYIFARRIKEFLAHLSYWLDESGSEIILDPHYYLIRQNNAEIF